MNCEIKSQNGEKIEFQKYEFRTARYKQNCEENRHNCKTQEKEVRHTRYTNCEEKVRIESCMKIEFRNIHLELQENYEKIELQYRNRIVRKGSELRDINSEL